MAFPPDPRLPYNLIVSGIPEVGAKSRVETQVKVWLKLTKAGVADQPYSSLKLPSHLLVGERFLPKKGPQAQNAPPPKNPLHVEVSVVSNSNPDQKVLRCSSCTQRERKLWSKKVEKSGALDSQHLTEPQSNEEIDQERIIIFHTLPFVDLINDEALLRARITCYCRHHEEKTGFRICFQLRNERDEIVAQGKSPPIMITDDHKPSRKLVRVTQSQDDDSEDSDDLSPPKKKVTIARNSTAEAPDMEKPQPQAQSAGHQPLPLPVAPIPVFPPPQQLQHQQLDQSLSQGIARQSYPSPGGGSFPFLLPQPMYPQMTVPQTAQSPQASMPDPILPKFSQGHPLSLPLLHHHLSPLGSPNSDSAFTMRPLPLHSLRSAHDSPSPRSWGSDARRAAELKITKVVPREGRLEGGMEVIVLGSGFYEGLVCYFGNQKAPASFCWSSGALVCVLPPSEKSYPEVVPIFLGPPPAPWKELACNDMIMFTYLDVNPTEKAMNIVAEQLSNGTVTGKEMAREIVSGGDTAIRKFLEYHSQAKSLNNFVN